MGIRYEKYKYGSDADGNRYEWRCDAIITSDISGDEIDENEGYIYDDLIITYDELYKKIVTEKVADKELECYWCFDPIKANEKYYEADGRNFHKDCLEEYLKDMYNVSDEWILNRHERDYDDYLSDLGDMIREES